MIFRLIIQPAVAVLFAIRAGLRDARKASPPSCGPFSRIRPPARVVATGAEGCGDVFIVALVLDAIYQVIVHSGIYTLELLLTATILALVPYVIVRGLVTRLARRRPAVTPAEGRPGDQGRLAKTSNKKGRKTDMQNDWTKPAAMAIPKEGFFEEEQGRYGPIFPKTPACYGFTIIAKIKPGTEQTIRAYGKTIEKTVAGLPDALAVLKLHYLRWVLFDIGTDTYFMYQGIFDTDFDKYTEDAVALFRSTGINTVFENLEGFPEDWKTNAPAFIKFVREHQCPSFLEYGEYPYVSADEIKKALRLKAAFSDDARPDAVSLGSDAHAGARRYPAHPADARARARGAVRVPPFREPAGGRAWLAGILDGAVGTGSATSVDADRRWVTVAFTWNGLRALGVDEASLATFPEEFRQGMARARRDARRHRREPSRQLGGRAGQPGSARHRHSVRARRRGARALRARASGSTCRAVPGVEVLSSLDLEATPPFDYAHDHFGYRDRLSQPSIEGIGRRADAGLGRTARSQASSSSAIRTRTASLPACRSRRSSRATAASWPIGGWRSTSARSATSCASTARRPRSRSCSPRS